VPYAKLRLPDKLFSPAVWRSYKQER